MASDGASSRRSPRIIRAAPVFGRGWHEGSAETDKAQFLSPTAAHVTCLHTGLEVWGLSGVLQVAVYEPLTQHDESHARCFPYAGTKERDQFKTTRPSLGGCIPRQRSISNWRNTEFVGRTANITSIRLPLSLILRSTETEGVRVSHFARGAGGLRLLMAAAARANLLHACFNRMDDEYRPNAPQVEAELSLLTTLEREFLAHVSGNGEVLALLTADHGQSGAHRSSKH